MAASSHPNPYVGAVIGLTPTSVDRWQTCRRHFLLENLLRVPALAPRSGGELGSAVHQVLQRLHESGACGDERAMADVTEHQPAVAPYVAAHIARCPSDQATYEAHELGLARFSRRTAPMWMLGGKIDAVWLHHGILDARDYKTGAVRTSRVMDDPAARAQAWLLAPLARDHGARLRLTYEHLGPDPGPEPDPWEPEDDDIDAVQQEMTGLAAAIASETVFAGVAEPGICEWCPYRPACPDAAR